MPCASIFVVRSPPSWRHASRPRSRTAYCRIRTPAIVGALMEGLIGPLAPTPDGDAAANREAVQTATLLALRALGVIDARARGLVAQCVLP